MSDGSQQGGEEGDSATTDGDGSEQVIQQELGDRIDRLVAEATETLEKIASKRDEEDLGPVLSLLDDLEDVADEAEDILSTVDLTELLKSIDLSELPSAIDLGSLPKAIKEGDATEAVALRKLIGLTNLRELWGSMDSREIWRQKREFDDEMDDLSDHADRDTSVTGFVGSDGDETDASSDDTAGSPHEIDPESVEKAIQSELSESVEEFRQKLLEAHERLDELRERNRERFPDRRRTRSRNPTAFSTMPSRSRRLASGTRHSTVPAETMYSTAPNQKRIYGTRFESARSDKDD